jgi:hypothetical protein
MLIAHLLWSTMMILTEITLTKFQFSDLGQKQDF